MPQVSVIMPLYNTAAFLDNAINSIIVQTFTDWELIICDDGSTDHSLHVAKGWAEKDSRIRVLKNSENKGHIYTYNRLLAAAAGSFIMIQDSDDWSESTRIEKQVAVLKQYTVGLCVTNSVFYSPEGVPRHFPRQETGVIDIHTEEHWAPATLMIRRSVLEHVPGYHPYFDRLTSMDRYFILEILDRFKGYYIDEYLYNVQVRANSDHRSIDIRAPFTRRKLIITDVYYELRRQRLERGSDWLSEQNHEQLAAYEARLLQDNKYIAEKIRNFASLQIDFRQFGNAWTLLKEAFRLSPFLSNNFRTLLYLLRTRVGLIR